MNYEDWVALRTSAQQSALLARALLGSLTADEQREILELLDGIFDALAEQLGYERRFTSYGSLGARFVWFPKAGGPGRLLTDLDFVCHPRLQNLAAFRSLQKRISRNQPQIATGLIVSLLITRDWEIHDYESILNAQAIFDSVQVAANEDSAAHRWAKRAGGLNKSASDKKRHADLEKKVTSICAASIRADNSRLDCWEHVQRRCRSGDGYPSNTTLRRAFQKAYTATSNR